MKLPHAYGVISTEAPRLLAAACDDLARTVPTCPGWDQFRLVGHQARVFHLAATVLERRMTDRPTADLLPDVPDSPAVVDYFIAAHARLLREIQAADPDAPLWTFGTGPHTPEFWGRRMAHEVTVHRVDAERAADMTHAPIDMAHAVDGVNEFLDIFSARVAPVRRDVALGGWLQLHATDADTDWLLQLRDGVLRVDRAAGPGSAAVRGAAADLYLGLWGRHSLSDGQMFDRSGDGAVIANWTALGGM